MPVLMVLASVVAGLMFINWALKRRWKDDPDAQFRFQLIMLSLTFIGGLTVIVALPVGDALRGQLLSLIGILLSAAIALSSTTFIGNVMAGIMLKAVKSARPGDFITVADTVGRITEMDLLHTEIQTEDRDLVTVPNLYMVTQPLRVVRASGTIVSAEVSLGYDISRQTVAPLLVAAAEKAGLKDPFVQVRELGDFSILYRVAGLLEEVKGLISARSNLREAMLDSLHEAGIEIVSPNFMNTRAIAENALFIPVQKPVAEAVPATRPEDLAFDKADEAASVEDIRKQIELAELALGKLEESDEESVRLSREGLEASIVRLKEQLSEAEKARAEAEVAEQAGSGSSEPDRS